MGTVWKYWDDCFIHGFKPGELEGKMLKGSGDFDPPPPMECPEECDFYHPERIGTEFCSFPAYKGICFYDPENQLNRENKT